MIESISNFQIVQLSFSSWWYSALKDYLELSMDDPDYLDLVLLYRRLRRMINQRAVLWLNHFHQQHDSCNHSNVPEWLESFSANQIQVLTRKTPPSWKLSWAYCWWFINLKLLHLSNLFCLWIPKRVLNRIDTWPSVRFSVGEWLFSDCYRRRRRCTFGTISGIAA